MNSNDSITNCIENILPLVAMSVRLRREQEGFLHWDIGNWSLFGDCLPTGRQGIWVLGLSVVYETTISSTYLIQSYP
jgi:hypothetical protein